MSTPRAAGMKPSLSVTCLAVFKLRKMYKNENKICTIIPIAFTLLLS